MPYTPHHARTPVHPAGSGVVLGDGPWSPSARAYLAVTTAWAVAIAVSTLVHPPQLVHQLAVTGHILSLAVAFGAVTTVDWHGVLWVTGRRDLREMTRVAQATAPLIWGGVGGLLVSGALLQPDLLRSLTWLKLGAVLLVLVNGVSVARSVGQLESCSPDARLRQLDGTVRRRMLRSAAVSQLCWWTVIAVGMITSAQRG